MIWRVGWNLLFKCRPVMHSVEIDSGGKQIRIVRQAHRGQIAAVGSATEATSLRIDVWKSLEMFSGGHNVFVLGAAAWSSVLGLAKMPSIHDAGTIVNGQHHISAA